MFQQKPLIGFRRASSDFHERPLAEHFFPVQAERQLALIQRFDRIVSRLDELPRSCVPDDHVSGAVVSFRNRSFEIRILDRMVLDFNCQAAISFLRGKALGHGPGL